MKISASKINTYLKCSWTFYCKYILKLPDTSNDGARRGTVTHLVLECLLNPRHKKYVDKCIKNPKTCKPVWNLTVKTARKEGVADEENLDLIAGFLKIGLKSDFFCEGYTMLPPEYKFDIDNKNPRYEILGFIDKSAFNDGEILVVDYKTSKNKPSGKDKDFNVQALSYALALHKKMPNIKKIKVRFLFLKFTRSPKLDYEFSIATLKGFETYLAKFYKLISNFGIKEGCKNFGKNNESWRLCGKKPGDVKKDGSPAWICPLKYPFLYWEARDADGKIRKTAFEKSELDELEKEGYSIEQKMYRGCPAFDGKR